MPKISYSEEERAKIRSSLLATALELMSKQGVRHTTVEQVYKKLVSPAHFSTHFSPLRKNWCWKRFIFSTPTYWPLRKNLRQTLR